MKINESDFPECDMYFDPRSMFPGLPADHRVLRSHRDPGARLVVKVVPAEQAKGLLERAGSAAATR